MARAEKIEEFIRECFEMYGLDYEEFADSSADVRNNPKKFLEIKDGLNMYGVTEAAKVLGVSPEALLNMDEDAAAKWYKKYPYFSHITGFDQAYRRSFHDDSYDTIHYLILTFQILTPWASPIHPAENIRSCDSMISICLCFPAPQAMPVGVGSTV